MKLFCLCLSMVFLSSAYARDPETTITYRETGGPERIFQGVGYMGNADFDSYLTGLGGFDRLYSTFKDSSYYKSETENFWETSDQFRSYLQSFGVTLPLDKVAMRIGVEEIFNTETDEEVEDILKDIEPRMDFEKKVEFIAIIGGEFLKNYDYSRTRPGEEAEKGIVTLRDMIEGHKQNVPAGVCRDMSQAQASMLKNLGVESYVLGYQSVESNHAVLLVQDPTMKSRTYNVNYNYVTKTISRSSTDHLLQDSQVPGFATTVRVYNADGEYLNNFPTHLGTLLHTAVGGDVRNLDPMLADESKALTAAIKINSHVELTATHGRTRDGDEVLAVGGIWRINSSNRVGIVFYENNRDSNIMGHLQSDGVYAMGEHRLTTPTVSTNIPTGVVGARAVTEVNWHVNSTLNQEKGEFKNNYSTGTYISVAAGAEVDYVSQSRGTQVSASLMGNTFFERQDIRDGYSMGSSLNNVTAEIELSQRLTQNLNSFARTSAVSRRDFGVQARQEAGLRYESNGQGAELVLGHEGQIYGEAPAFVPGSQERYYSDFGTTFSRGHRLSAGVFCDPEREDCGVRVNARVRLGGG